MQAGAAKKVLDDSRSPLWELQSVRQPALLLPCAASLPLNMPLPALLTAAVPNAVGASGRRRRGCAAAHALHSGCCPQLPQLHGARHQTTCTAWKLPPVSLPSHTAPAATSRTCCTPGMACCTRLAAVLLPSAPPFVPRCAAPCHCHMPPPLLLASKHRLSDAHAPLAAPHMPRPAPDNRRPLPIMHTRMPPSSPSCGRARAP